ncbi:uncharacterized protein LOC128211438 isoform X2 [Mya arenaria]|uniref:uncharacterized protein LOC128211438 isoform X2 n=1 Tax=Mya arenaria TaxID=6604 RepID=UPI0022DEB629|nr:uncharacterized protein LOC128211438 isoform X2 [Mya arenaria]
MASGNGKFGCNVSPEERVRNNATSGGQSVKIYPDLTQFQEATQNGSTSDRIAETCVLNITKLQANKGSFSWCFLVELGIEQYLWKQNVYTQGLKVEADNKEIRFTNTKHENERIITLIEEFLTSMQVISVSDIYNLQILQNRNTNEKLLDFLRTHIDVIPHTHVVLHSDEKEVFFGCKDEQSLRIFVSNLQNVVFKREFNIADGECREMIKALQMSGQLYILCSDQETEHMLCTQPVIKQLDEHMQCIFQVRLLPLQVEYFASFGKIKVQELGLENGLQIDLNKGNKTLTFRGKRCDIKAMDDRLKTYFQLKKIKIALPRNILPTFEGTAMAAVSEQQCCYSINWRPSAEKGPGNRLIASWKSKDGNGVTLIQGRLFDLDVDAVVILANTSMSPRTTIAEEDIVTQFKDVNVMLKKIPTKLGKVFEVGDEKNQRSYIAITDSSSATSLDEPICYQVLKVHLERLRRKGCQSVAIHASVFPETHVCTKDITNWFIKASLEVPEMSYYLCADNKDDLGQIAEDVRLNCLSSKPSHNYLRQTFAVDVVFGEPRMLEVHIRNGTLIADQKADIIVNTTGKSLQLEKGGALSRSIVLAAGVQLQDELSKEYPGGLNEGQIAVTSSGKLSRNGVHEIIHCVLPKFDKEKFDDDIKAMVKTCLAEADKLQGKSIALPPFGTGRHGYPIRETALAMFEAIDEFSEESVGMTLQTIYIPTLEDEHCKAFISAQSKRSSSPDRKKINNENMVDFYKHIGNGQYSLRVCVGNIFLLKFLPRSTLHVYFAVGAGEQGLNWEEKKDNDYTWIGISDEISHIVHAVETVLDACIEKMITDVALFSPVQQLDREDFTDVQFVQTVIRAFERDPAKLRYLRSALILLASGTNIASLEKMLCGTKMNTLRTYVGNSSFVGMPWVKPPDPAVEMCVYGAGEKTSIALGNIEQITSSPHSFGKETETKKELDLGTNVDDDYDVIEEIQTKQTVCETPKKPLIDAEEVRLTATINQGIVKYLQSHEALDAWSIDVQKCFGISLQSSDNCIKVQGRCRNVSMFENYLQNFFPNEPDYAKGQMELAYSGLSFDDRHFADVSNDGSYSELIAKLISSHLK